MTLDQSDLTKRASELKPGEFFRDPDGVQCMTVGPTARDRDRVSVEAVIFAVQDGIVFELKQMPTYYLVMPMPAGTEWE